MFVYYINEINESNEGKTTDVVAETWWSIRFW